MDYAYQAPLSMGFSNFLCLCPSPGDLPNPGIKAMSLMSPTLAGRFFTRIALLLFIPSVVSDSLPPHGEQHPRLHCPSPSPRTCSNSSPLSQWHHPTISSSVSHPLLLLPSIFPSISVFPNESALCIRWTKYWSFSISPSNEYSRLIPFGIDWFDLLAVQGTLKSLLQHQKESILRAHPSLWSISHIHTRLLEKP